MNSDDKGSNIINKNWQQNSILKVTGNKHDTFIQVHSLYLINLNATKV